MGSNYYLEFENKFRGDRQKILNILSSYDPLIEIAIEGKVSPKLIDVGCGRGEWLERCKNKFYQSIGIESDSYMASFCIDNGLSVIEGDAIQELSRFENGSISVITMFHVIEHLDYFNLKKLIFECQRILSDDGVLIMETPSIDNLIVSTKSFYIDHTHINPINVDAISFHLEQVGFSNVKHYYINGGPLQQASPLKITRILNGVAQDLCIISTKSQSQYNKMFSESTEWQSHLNIGLTLFEAAIEFDLKLESLIDSYEKLKNNNQSNNDNILLREEVSLLRHEISFLKSRLTIVIYADKILKKIKKIIIYFFNLIRKILALIFNKILNILLNIGYIRRLLISENFYLIIQSILKILGNLSNSKVVHIKNKLEKILVSNRRFVHYNQKLFFHYEQSKKCREYLETLTRKNQ